MDELKFRKWFWKAMGDFIDIAYYPPGLDKLKTDTYFGFNAVLEDAECEEKFTGELQKRASELETQRTLHLNYVCKSCDRHFYLPAGSFKCECGGQLWVTKSIQT